MPPPPFNDLQAIGICPGEGKFVRDPGWLGGIPTDKALGYKGIPEYQLAQAAMFAYFYVDFKARYPVGSFVLADAAWAYLLTGITKGDKMLDVLRDSFRRWHKRGGQLKPDILGFCAMPSQSGLMVLEMAEVTTAKEAVSTLREDLNYKLGSMRDIIEGLRPSILDSFSLSNYAVRAVATKWKPAPMQRIIPLPLRSEANTVTLEWICFQPTFYRNPPHGIDGLLLYEIHSMRFKRDFVPEAVLRKFTEEERRRRASAKLANGLLLTPWLTQQTLNQEPFDRETMMAFAIVAGVGLAVLVGIMLFPVVSGFELALLGELLLGTGEAEVGAAALSQATGGTTAAIELGSQWSAATGFPIMAGSTMAPVLLR